MAVSTDLKMEILTVRRKVALKALYWGLGWVYLTELKRDVCVVETMDD
jgi:hypothetical protein